MATSQTRNICVCINAAGAEKCKEELLQYPFAELRADLCGLTEKQVESLISSHPDCIFTFRFSEKDESLALSQYLTAIGKGVSFVDVDVKSSGLFLGKIREAISAQPERLRTQLIISSHPDNVPSLKDMEGIADECWKKGADIVKIAPLAKSVEEASRVLGLYRSKDIADKKELVAFARGEAGRFTRISCLGLGAPFTYCSSGNPVAEGQYSYDEMKALTGGGKESRTFKIQDAEESQLFSRFCNSIPDQRKNMKRKFVCVPCSKSIVQRALIAAAICNGQTVLRNFDPCADTDAAIAFIRKCGCIVKVSRDGSSARGEKMIIVRSAGIAKWKSFKFADAGESALLARLLLPVSALASNFRNSTLISAKTSITGSGSLLGRDVSLTVENLKKSGVKCSGTRNSGKVTLPINISGASFRKNFTISGKETSQLISGLLIALPLAGHNTKMEVEDAVSIPFIEMTIKVLEAFGIRIAMKREKRNLRFEIEGNQNYVPVDMFLESDWSSASNFAVAGAIASKCSCQGNQAESFTIKKMNQGTAQADEVILKVLEQCGADVRLENPEITEFSTVQDNRFFTRRSFFKSLRNVTVKAHELKAFSFDATDSPDLFPILATLAVYCEGESRIKGVHRLDKKESNRTVSILQEFGRMGYDVSVEDDEMVIRGNGGKVNQKENVKEIFCSSHNDHRMAMAIIICALFRKHAGNPPVRIYLDNVSCIDKSFPTFVERLKFADKGL